MSKKMKYSLMAMAILLIAYVAISFLGNNSKLPSFEYDDVNMVQLSSPEKGQEIAIIDTTLGSFKVALYREYAPNTVKSFVDLANAGYYDGKYVFIVEKDQYFLAGTTNSNGIIVEKDEENYDTEMTKTENEISKNLWPLKGSFISFGPDYKDNGIFFAGINTMEFSDKFKEELKNSENANPEIVNAFIEKGGMPYMSSSYTVFAQTYEGMDVFEKLCNAEVKSSKNQQPAEDIKINSIKISTFE